MAWLQHGVGTVTETTSPEVILALQISGACVVCWFTGYASGSVVRAMRRLMGKGAR